MLPKIGLLPLKNIVLIYFHWFGDVNNLYMCLGNNPQIKDMSISWTFNAHVGKNTIYIPTTHCLTKSNSLSQHFFQKIRLVRILPPTKEEILAKLPHMKLSTILKRNLDKKKESDLDKSFIMYNLNETRFYFNILSVLYFYSLINFHA